MGEIVQDIHDFATFKFEDDYKQICLTKVRQTI